jgi:hypothetical protein
VIARVGVEPPFHGPGRYVERLSPRRRFDRLEV